jgi:hypothetical protein
MDVLFFDNMDAAIGEANSLAAKFEEKTIYIWQHVNGQYYLQIPTGDQDGIVCKNYLVINAYFLGGKWIGKPQNLPNLPNLPK